MSLIAAAIAPHGVTRIFFDCRPGDPDRHDEERISRAIEQAAATASPEANELSRAA
jgi:hypothetical protein